MRLVFGLSLAAAAAVLLWTGVERHRRAVTGEKRIEKKRTGETRNRLMKDLAAARRIEKATFAAG